MSTSETESPMLITRREAMQRVVAILGGVALVGGSAMLTACGEEPSAKQPADPPAGRPAAGERFSAEDVAYLDEIADTILPTTRTPGAKAAKTGAFMALMVTDSYHAPDQQAFRQGMRTIDEASRKASQKSFMQATPEQRLAVLTVFDKEQKAESDARAARAMAATRQPDAPKPAPTADNKDADKHLPDERKENAIGAEASGAVAITAEPPVHFFRMMKELALLGYFTSEIGCTQAQRYVESPGKFEPCVPYTKGEPAWAPHA